MTAKDKPVVLIMAGGKGERFWPRSRASTPKQLQKVYSNKTLLKETIDRALTLTSIDRIFIGTNAALKKSILQQEKSFPEKNFILEPEGKNTAPIVALASLS
jgi:mannose-1-phosphate guanylyltransferase